MSQAPTAKHESDFVNKLPAITQGGAVLLGRQTKILMNAGHLTSTLVFFTQFVAAVGMQLMVKHHHPFLYWTVIVATSTAGTTVSDYMDRTLALG